MARSVWREEDAEYCEGGEWGGWVRMMDTSLSQLVDGGEGGLEQYFTVFTSGDLLSSLLYADGEVMDIFLFLFIPLSGMSSAVTSSS
jgi:hypothetical protein